MQREDRPVIVERQNLESEGIGITFDIGTGSFALEARDKTVLRQYSRDVGIKVAVKTREPGNIASCYDISFRCCCDLGK